MHANRTFSVTLKQRLCINIINFCQKGSVTGLSHLGSTSSSIPFPIKLRWHRTRLKSPSLLTSSVIAQSLLPTGTICWRSPIIIITNNFVIVCRHFHINLCLSGFCNRFSCCSIFPHRFVFSSVRLIRAMMILLIHFPQSHRVKQISWSGVVHILRNHK